MDVTRNIHILDTNKPSRLYKIIGSYKLGLVQSDFLLEQTAGGTQNCHVYITIDGRFTEGSYVTDGVEVIKATPKIYDAQGLVNRRNWRKIIITSDADLIGDGVQEASEDLLEWIVSRPNEVSLPVRKKWKAWNNKNPDEYKTEIPKKCCESGFVDYYCKNVSKCSNSGDKKPGETLEEAIDSYYKREYSTTIPNIGTCRDFARFGARWHADQLKSDEVIQKLEENLEELLKKCQFLYNEDAMVSLIQYLSMNEEFAGYSSVSKETAKKILDDFKING